MPASAPSPNPRRAAAGRRNRALWKGLTPAGAERLRQAALAHKPWTFSTGPTTAAGKAASAANGRVRQAGPESVRAARRELSALVGLLGGMAELRSATRAARPA